MVDAEKPARSRPLVAAVHRRDGRSDVLEPDDWAPPPPGDAGDGDPVVIERDPEVVPEPADPLRDAARRASAPLGPDDHPTRRTGRPSGPALPDRIREAPVRQVLEGVALCLLGLGLLLGWVVHVPWTSLIDLGLVALGALLVVQSRTGSPSRPLIAVGVLLALVALGTWRADTTLEGGLGRRTVTPARSATRSYDYRLGTGQLTIDLRKATLTPGQPLRVDAEVGLGRIVVRVPKGVLVQTRSVAGGGTTLVFDDRKVGPGVESTAQTAGTPDRTIVLDLSVGLGSVEVRRG
jgi:hypothetical protein